MSKMLKKMLKKKTKVKDTPTSAGHLNETTDVKAGVDIGVATWNILADGLALGEFMNRGGDQIAYWKNRGPKVASGIHAMLSSGNIGIVATQENDHPTWILQEVQKRMPSVKMACMLKGENAPQFYVNRLSDYLTKNRHFSESSDMCEFNCNGDKPGCSKKAKCLEAHAKKIGEFLNEFPEVRDTLIGEGLTCSTYRDECFIPPEGKSADDLYYCKDCLAVYYDSDLVKLNTKLDLNGMVDYGDDKRFRLEFTHTKESKDYNFTILVAHLKSGEDKKGEMKRVEELTKLLDKATECENPIILMDSNTCWQYAETIKRNFENKDATDDFLFVNALIHNKGFKNLIEEDHIRNKAIKMRHAKGEQPKKFGEFFFDTIDKIVVHKNTKTTPIILEDSVPSDLRLYPDKHFKFMNTLRNNVEFRAELKQVCIIEKWGPDMSDNKTNKFDEFVKSKGVFKEFGSVKEVLEGLYPSTNMPSDHPPVAAMVRVEEHVSDCKRRSRS